MRTYIEVTMSKVSVVGRNAKRIRMQLGLKPVAAGKRTKLAHTTIRRVESGEIANPTTDTIQKLSRGYGIPEAELFKEDGKVNHRDGQ
jgi:transcriptional regulator with XRE-family HTH domain